MKQNIELNNIEHRMIEYKLHQETGKYRDIIIYINASYEYVEVDVEDGYCLLYHSEKEKIENNHLKVTGVSLAILVR